MGELLGVILCQIHRSPFSEWPSIFVGAPSLPTSPTSRSYSSSATTTTTARPCFSIATGPARARSISRPKSFLASRAYMRCICAPEVQSHCSHYSYGWNLSFGAEKMGVPEWLSLRHAPKRSQPQVRPRSRRKLEPAWWAPSGFAAIPTAALDPAHSPASPAVPALDLGPRPRCLPQTAIRPRLPLSA